MEPVIKQVEKKHVAGVGAKFISVLSPDTNNKNVIGDLWSQYNSRKQEIVERANQSDLGIVMSVKDEQKAHPNEMFYIAGTEVKSTDSVPNGMTVTEIPAGTYAVFTHKGPISNIGATMKYIYGSWLPNSGKQRRNAPEFEVYDERFKHDADASELDIYIPIQ